MMEFPKTLTAQVFKIAGNRPSEMGTGFAIYRNDKSIYIVTCRHVIDQVGEGEKRDEGLTVDGKPARLLYSDVRHGFDLAILCVDTEQLTAPIFSLRQTGHSGMPFRSAGFYKLTDYFISQDLNGKLCDSVQISSDLLNKRSTAWWIEVSGNTRLELGNSGAPVVNEDGAVIGVISVRQGEGNRGLAISIEALRYIWYDMPSELFMNPLPSTSPIQSEPPLMNCVPEMAAFQDYLLNNRKTSLRAIVLQGDHGCGKTRLLTEYRRLATQCQLKVIHFDLGEHVSIERCLERIVDKIAGKGQFVEFKQSLHKEKPESRNKQIEWEVHLTRAFFADLCELKAEDRLFIFFDHFEKADSPFRAWLLDEFIARLDEKPLKVIIAGCSDLERTQRYEWVQYFTPKIPEISYFYNYAQQFGIHIQQIEMHALFNAFKTSPKNFVDYVNARRLQQQGY